MTTPTATRYQLVGLDLALNSTGYAHVDRTLETIRPARGLDGYDRHYDVAERVLRAIAKDRPDVVLLEGYAPHMPGAIATIRSAELGGIVRAAMQRHGVTWLEVAPSTLKRWATGNGNARKPAMTSRAVELGARLSKPTADDEADAFLLKLLGEDLYNGDGVTAWPDALAVLNGPIPASRR
jgi:crossover junction endodeoxyribonuclease RuvC